MQSTLKIWKSTNTYILGSDSVMAGAFKKILCQWSYTERVHAMLLIINEKDTFDWLYSKYLCIYTKIVSDRLGTHSKDMHLASILL